MSMPLERASARATGAKPGRLIRDRRNDLVLQERVQRVRVAPVPARIRVRRRHHDQLQLWHDEDELSAVPPGVADIESDLRARPPAVAVAIAIVRGDRAGN